MEEVTKRIDYENGDSMLFATRDGYVPIKRIEKYYSNSEGYHKVITFCMWDDFSISGWANKDEIQNNDILDFDFDINDPIYFCLNRLIGDKFELIIEDDESLEMKKYMTIRKSPTKIKVTFYNHKTEEERKHDFDRDKFNMFIKNIGPDARSKMEFEDKLKLVDFFNDCEKVLTEDYHQTTLDEYIETERYERFKRKVKER